MADSTLREAERRMAEQAQAISNQRQSLARYEEQMRQARAGDSVSGTLLSLSA
jgi:hypothetical protein